MQQLETALLLVVVTERLCAAVTAPIKQKWPGIDLWWMIYVSWLWGGALVFLAGVNLFPGIFRDDLTGQALSAIIAGGGANLLHDIFKARQQ